MFSFHLAHIIEIIMFYKAKYFHPPIRGCIRKVNIGNVLRKGKTCFLSHRNSIRSSWLEKRDSKDSISVSEDCGREAPRAKNPSRP